jgi:transposase-like protein
MTDKNKGRTSQTTEFKNKLIKEAGETGNIKAVAEKYNIQPPTLYSWVRNFKNKDQNQAKKTIKQLEQELADSELENKVLKELLKKTTQALIKD